MIFDDSRTLGDCLAEQAAARPDAPALLADDRQLTWSQLDAEVNRVARLLASVGVGRGDAVGFVINKRAEVVTGFLALARLGAIMVPVNFKLTLDQVRDQFETGRIRTVFVEKEHEDLLRGLRPVLHDPRRIVWVGPGARLGESSYADSARFSADPLDVAVHADEPVYYNGTSGTTGRPKMAITTHRNIVVQGLTAFDAPDREGLGFTADHVFLGMFSVFAHPHELFHRSLLCGGAFVIMDSLSPRIIAKTIERFRVSWMMAVPSFYEMLLDYQDGEGADLSSLKVLESGGAFVGADTLRRMEERFGAAFMPVWGSTETTGVAIALRPDRARAPGTTGRPIAGYEVRIVDGHGRDCPPGEVGEMIVRGPAVVSGYVNDEAETQALFQGGWYYTRDLCSWTEDGFVQFAGRRSEMLKIGGIRVYPLEIERVIKEHPEVRDVVVVRAEERIRGEVARAVVETTPGSSLNLRKLQAYCRDRLAPYKVPRFVEFWKSIPKLPNGKIDKRAVLAVPPDPARDER